MQDSKKAKPKEAALGVHFWGFFHFWKNGPVLKRHSTVASTDSFGDNCYAALVRGPQFCPWFQGWEMVTC